MRILHRYLVLELLWNATLFLAVIITIYFVMALALLLGRTTIEGLPMWVVFKATWYTVISNLHLIVPLTILSGAIFTYGRAHGDGEFTAMRVAGIHPYQVLVPALFVGSLGTMGLAWLQDEVIPKAHFASRVELRKDVFMNLDEILRRSRREIVQKRWSARWQDAVDDAQGNLVLRNLLIVQRNKEGLMDSRLLAENARPIYMARQNKLHLELENVSRYEADGPPKRAGRFEMDLDLDELSTKDSAIKRKRDFSYEELLSRWRHLEARAASVSGLPGTGESAARKARQHRCLYHFRIAFSFSSLFFALLGATLGLFRPVSNRAIVFLVGFLLVVGIYYPLQQWGRRLGDTGSLHPGVALWIGNAVLLGFSLFLFRRVCRE